MSSRVVRTNMRVRRRDQQVTDMNGAQSENQGDQQGTGQASMVPQVLSGPPMIDIEAIEDDDDVVESTASAFAQAKNRSRGARRGPLVVDVESGSTTTLGKNRTRLRSDHDNGDSFKLHKSRKSKAVEPPVDEPKFNCPICLCPFTEEVSTKCGHIFCKECIKNAILRQAKCPTCRKNVTAKSLIRRTRKSPRHSSAQRTRKSPRHSSAQRNKNQQPSQPSSEVEKQKTKPSKSRKSLGKKDTIIELIPSISPDVDSTKAAQSPTATQSPKAKYYRRKAKNPISIQENLNHPPAYKVTTVIPLTKAQGKQPAISDAKGSFPTAGSDYSSEQHGDDGDVEGSSAATSSEEGEVSSREEERRKMYHLIMIYSALFMQRLETCMTLSGKGGAFLQNLLNNYVSFNIMLECKGTK